VTLALASAAVGGELALSGQGSAQPPPTSEPAAAAPQPPAAQLEALQTRYFMTIPGSSHPVS
jgi:hypothetical protein